MREEHNVIISVFKSWKKVLFSRPPPRKSAKRDSNIAGKTVELYMPDMEMKRNKIKRYIYIYIIMHDNIPTD